MNYILHYNIAAIGIMLLTIYILVTRKDVNRSDNRLLLVLCVMHMISAVSETIAIRMLLLSRLIAGYRKALPDNMFAQSLGLLGMMITLENKDDVRGADLKM